MGEINQPPAILVNRDSKKSADLNDNFNENSKKIAKSAEISPQLSGKGFFSNISSRQVLVFTALALVIFSIGALWRLTPPPKGEPLKSIAVLPLMTQNAQPDERAFAEQLTQDLTRNLGRVTSARVAAYEAVASLDSPDLNLRKIGEDLQVEGFVTGEIKSEGGAATELEIKINDSASGALLWQKRYALDRRNLAESQYRVANDIARELGKNREIQNPAAAVGYEAYQSYLLARHHLDKRTTKDYEAAIKNFTGAIAKDSAFADAHAGLATTHVLHGQNIYAARGLSAFGESFPAAKRSAVRALEINPNSDEALAVLALVNYRFEYNWKNAETNFKRAIEINSNNVLAHRWYGEFLHHVGRFEEGFVVQKKALALEPNSTLILGETARGNYLARHFDEAAKNIKAALSIDKDNAAALYKASEIYEQKKDYTQAAALWHNAMIVEEANPKSIAHLEESFQKAGYHGFVRAKTDWLENLTEIDYVYPTDLAKGYTALGEKDKAFEWLEKAVEARVPDILIIKYAPAFDSLRDDARFQKIFGQINFPQ